MRAILLCLLALLLASCSPSEPEAPTSDTLTLTPQDDGSWIADFTFAEPASEWVFVRSRGDYRTSTWTALSENTSLIREDGFDRIRLTAPAKL